MNNYYWKMLSLFLILVIVFSFFKANALLPLSGKIIIVDPGHGGTYLSQINYNANNISS